MYERLNTDGEILILAAYRKRHLLMVRFFATPKVLKKCG